MNNKTGPPRLGMLDIKHEQLKAMMERVVGIEKWAIDYNYTVEDAPDIELKPEPPTKSAPQKPKKKSKPQRSVKATILKTIKKNKDGIKAKDLQEQTGFTSKQISNNMFHLKKEQKVKKIKEGLFIAL